ncbi:MAG: S8 family serine peptidase [Acidobacteria bacterium]|nr:S8 family serine peptidase [Acidobacteriota bacterium]MBV9184915.1 S8 family serine peptidase [Acidobacteriota bacterium]
MKRAAFVALLFIAPLTAFASAPTQAVIVMTKPTTHFAAKSLSAMFDPNISADERDLRELSGINGFAANLTEAEIAALKASGTTVSIEPDLERHALVDTVTAGKQTTPFGMTSVNAPSVWPVTRGKSLANGPAIHVAIIDTGIDYNFSELSGVFKGGYNFVARTGDPLDDAGHGTHVAGIIAAANDGAGVVGVASDVDIYSLKVLDTCGSGRTSDIIQAVQWVVDKKKEIGGNWIINLSLGADQSSGAEQTQFQTAADAGILVFAASGNGYPDSVGLAFPAGYPTVVSVGAVEKTNAIATFSQRGADLKLVAPGCEACSDADSSTWVGILSTFVSPMVSTNDGRRISALRADYADATDSTKLVPLTFSACPPNTTGITSTFVSCGLGNPSDFPASVKGKIALVQRGTLTFIDKASNAAKAGAIGIIVYNNVDGPLNAALGTTAKSAAAIPATAPFLGITQADGQALLATPNATITMSSGFEQFAYEQGTSMSCPYAVGAAALVWATSPNSTAANVATALEQTAKDLGAPGKDDTFGYGLVNALDAAKMLNPSAFDPVVTPVIGPVHGRMAGRRGH